MDIRQISLDINYVIDVVLPFKQLKHVTSADVDRKTGEIYWTDSSEDVIQKSRSDGNVRTIMWHELQMAEAIAIDSSGRKVSVKLKKLISYFSISNYKFFLQIYWTDGGRNSIEVAELSGRNRKLLIWEDVDTPRALVLHYQNGIMFWSDWGTSPRIELAHMDGTNRYLIKMKLVNRINILIVNLILQSTNYNRKSYLAKWFSNRQRECKIILERCKN